MRWSSMQKSKNRELGSNIARMEETQIWFHISNFFKVFDEIFSKIGNSLGPAKRKRISEGPSHGRQSKCQGRNSKDVPPIASPASWSNRSKDQSNSNSHAIIQTSHHGNVHSEPLVDIFRHGPLHPTRKELPAALWNAWGFTHDKQLSLQTYMEDGKNCFSLCKQRIVCL